jgi:hypothetical protein
MSRLADQYGISGNGLAKICRRLAVPYPPRGWWAKKEADKPLTNERLPLAQPGTPTSVSISPTATDTGGVRAEIREKLEEIGDIIVPQRLVRRHPLIASWLHDRRERIEEARRERDPWRRSLYAVADFTQTERRRHRLLHALFNALERHGAAISETDRRQLVVTICNEKIEISLQEKSRQVTRPMTPDEKRWESWNKSGVKTELEPTGHFQFSIKSWIDQPIRKNWLENDKRPMEEMLSEIAATLLVLGSLRAERTRARREQARVYEEEQRSLELQRQRRQQDENRWTRFIEIAEASKRAELARAFIARLRELDMSGSELIDGLTVNEWLTWAEERAAASDPIARGAERIFAEIAQVTAWTSR